MKRRTYRGIPRTFHSDDGQHYRLSSTGNEVHAQYRAIIVASLSLEYHIDAWRVQRVWVEKDYRRRGIATALYDYAFHRGFRPLKGGRIQTAEVAALWRTHIVKKLAVKGVFRHRDHPDEKYWWPL